MASFQALIDRIDAHETFLGVKFDSLVDKVSSVEKTLAAHVAGEGQIEQARIEFQASVKKALDGNGKPGIKSRVDRLEDRSQIIFWACSAVVVPSVLYVFYVTVQALAKHFGIL